MPDVKGAGKKAEAAKNENAIVYPEYHIPFTNNHITIEKITGETEAVFTDINANEVRVTRRETHEYNNSISVKQTAEKDANETAAVIGLVGTVLTVPVSAVTWFIGAVYGAAED